MKNQLITIITIFFLSSVSVSISASSVYAYACKADCPCPGGSKQTEQRYCAALGDTCSGSAGNYLCPDGSTVTCGDWYGSPSTGDCPADTTPVPTATPTLTATPIPPTETPVPPTPTTPVITPTPAGPDLANMNRTCSTTTSEATFSWNAVAGVTNYILRVSKEPAADWFGPGDHWKCVNGTSETRTIDQGAPYELWSVQSSEGSTCKDANGVNIEYGKTVSAGFTCPNTVTPTTPPNATPTPIPGYCTQGKSITLSAPPATDAGTITIKVKFQGAFLNNITANNNEKKIKVTIIKQLAEQTTGIGLQTISSKTFENVIVKNTNVADANGIAIWKGSFTPTAIVPGSNYSIMVKGPHHLQRKFCINNPTEQADAGLPYKCNKVGQIVLTSQENQLEFSNVLLQGGDLPGTQGQDGIVNAYDVSLLMTILSKGTSINAQDLLSSDMDYNGIVNAKDRSNIIETLEEKYGDDE